MQGVVKDSDPTCLLSSPIADAEHGEDTTVEQLDILATKILIEEKQVTIMC